MPYIDKGQATTTIGNCRYCKFSWVVAEDTKGKTGSDSDTRSGQVCPFCGSNNISYSSELNR